MTGRARLKLIEHSLPLEKINLASIREKPLWRGHPSTLHKWWAPRPLAACRAVLFSQLVDDPSAWPDKFPSEEEQAKERRRLHKIIEKMVEWPKADARDQKRFQRAIEEARYEIARSVAWGRGEEPPTDPKDVIDYLQANAPLVYDPFCGGGAIPLEAQRLGLRAHGSDLNPVAVLITKALIEVPSNFVGLPPIHPDAKQAQTLAGRDWEGAQGLAEDVRRYGQWMHDEAQRRTAQLYPQAMLPDGSKATVIAWLWARTVASPDPAQKGAHVPLASSFVLSSKTDKKAIAIPVKDPNAKDGWRFTVKTEGVTEQDLADAEGGTKTARGSNFTCILSGAAIDGDHVKAEGSSGRMGARLMTIVAESARGRVYLQPTAEHEQAAEIEAPDVPELEQRLPDDPRNFWTVQYGLDRFVTLFTPRQLAALITFSDLVGEVRQKVIKDAITAPAFANHADPERPLADGGRGPAAYADAVAMYLGLSTSKMTMFVSTQSRWRSGEGKTAPGFGRQALPMIWDFAEINPFAGAGGDLSQVISAGVGFLQMPVLATGHAEQKAAQSNDYPKNSLLCTDPPYYNNVAYADLSDYFYVWLRKCLKKIFPDLFRRLITPKEEELVATPYRHGGDQQAERHFMTGMAQALEAMRASSTDSPVVIYYAFKQSETREVGEISPGWAAFLQAIVNAGLQVDATWPLQTEMATRQIASGTNALASSVVLVCRARPEHASAIGARDFQRELKPAMKRAIEEHQKAGVPLPDRRQAAIGPGIGIFSKYAWVREIDDSRMSVARALALINREIDEALSEGTEALDPETRFALEWYEINGHRLVSGGAGMAISMLQGFNLAESHMNASGLFRARGGDAKLLTPAEMHEADPEWSPTRDGIFTIWEMAHHLLRVFHAQDGGIDQAGRILAESRRSGPDVLLVAERLFEIATRTGHSEEALRWNQLQTAWPEIERAADRAEEAGIRPASVQAQFDFPALP